MPEFYVIRESLRGQAATEYVRTARPPRIQRAAMIMGCISPALSASRSSRAARDPLDRGASARRRHSLSYAANASGAPLARRKHRCIPRAHRPWTRGFCGDSRRMLKAETRWRSSTVSSSSHEIDATTGYRFVVTRWRRGRDSNLRYRFTFCFARAGPEVAGFSGETYRQLSREDCSP